MKTDFKPFSLAGGVNTAHALLRAFCKRPASVCKGGARPLAINAEPNRRGHALAVGTAVNADTAPAIPATGDDWLLLAPYGETVYWNEEKSVWKKYRQIFQQSQALQMQAAFNTLATKKGARFRGLPIYAGHPDGDPTRWPDERRLGGVMGLEARADGVYVKAAWNDLGEQNRTQGYLVYPSPAWLYDLKAARTQGIIAPDELRSVGLTNSPRIADVPAWTNADQSPEIVSDNPEDTMIKKLLAKILGVAEDATEEQLQTAYNSLFAGDATGETLRTLATNAASAQTTAESTLSTVRADLATEQGRVVAANSERDTAQREATSFRAVAINALLDGAIVAGKLSAADRAGMQAKFEANFDGAKAELAGKKAAFNTTPLHLTRDTSDLSTPTLRRTAYNAKAEELRRTKQCKTEEQVVAAMRDDPHGRLILEAMETADKVARAA